jgi:hypothetical protein
VSFSSASLTLPLLSQIATLPLLSTQLLYLSPPRLRLLPLPASSPFHYLGFTLPTNCTESVAHSHSRLSCPVLSYLNSSAYPPGFFASVASAHHQPQASKKISDSLRYTP